MIRIHPQIQSFSAQRPCPALHPQGMCAGQFFYALFYGSFIPSFQTLSCLPLTFFFPLCGKTLNKWISAEAEFAELKQGSFFTIIQSSKENKHKNKTKANTKAKQKKTHKSNHSKLSKNVLGGEKNGRLVKS